MKKEEVVFFTDPRSDVESAFIRKAFFRVMISYYHYPLLIKANLVMLCLCGFMTNLGHSLGKCEKINI